MLITILGSMINKDGVWVVCVCVLGGGVGWVGVGRAI